MQVFGKRGWPVALALCCALAAGCAGNRQVRIDPGGRHILTSAPIKMAPVPGEPRRWHRTGVILTPVKVVAPIGAEVVMLAGVCGRDKRLLADQRVEWMLAPGGVGQFVEVGKGGALDWLRFGDNFPRKVDNTFAIGLTSTRYIVLTRGTPTPIDDVPVLRGQAWITVTSPIEGTSHVTAYAPDVYGWGQRQQAGVIHWVDAEWAFPPPAVNPVGTRHVFSTWVTRATDKSPLSDWRVRYQIVGGPPAGFTPDGAQIVEVPTDAVGQASVELFQTQPQPGTNTIAIQIIRPASPGSSRLVLAEGTTTKTWTSPRISLRKTGPAYGSLGATLSYRIEVSNPGDLPARDIVVTDVIPEGLAFSAADPPATPQAGQVQWQFAELAPGAVQTIQVDMIAQRLGTVQNCASVTAADGLTAQDCVTTTMLEAALDVSITGPDRAEVGSSATFEIAVTNRGDAPATDVVIVNRFDEGFEHETAASPIERDLGRIEPGQSQRIGVTLRVTRPGRLCTRVEVSAQGSPRAQAEACLNAEPPPQPSISVRKRGPESQSVGGTAEFAIEITNTGPTAVNELRVTDAYDESLEPIRATEGYGFEEDALVWRIAAMQPGETVRLQIHCRCQAPVARACNRVAVTTREGVGAQDEACLSIVETPPRLSVSVGGSANPVELGRVFHYNVVVRNAGTDVAENIALVATAPPGITLLEQGTVGPGQFTIEAQTIRFAPVDRLAPGQQLTYQIQVRGDQDGEVRFQVEARATGLAEGVTAEEATRVFRRP